MKVYTNIFAEILTAWHALVEWNSSCQKKYDRNIYRLCQRKIIQFSVFNYGKSKQSTATILWWPKHNFSVCKKVFKWYHSIIRCKSYGPMSDEW